MRQGHLLKAWVEWRVKGSVGAQADINDDSRHARLTCLMKRYEFDNSSQHFDNSPRFKH